MIEYLSNFNLVFLVIIASLGGRACYWISVHPYFFTRNISKRLLDAFPGATAVIMLAATSFSLIIQAIEKGGVAYRALLLP